MSEDQSRVPLSMTVQIPGNKDAKAKQYYRRARSNVRGVRANTLPADTGVPVSRIVRDTKTIRKWALRRGMDVNEKGPIPGPVRDEFERVAEGQRERGVERARDLVATAGR